MPCIHIYMYMRDVPFGESAALAKLNWVVYLVALWQRAASAASTAMGQHHQVMRQQSESQRELQHAAHHLFGFNLNCVAQ